MQIKTITCHDVYNSGASLQAYALQTYLASLGHEVEIIDYKPGYLSNHFNLLTISNPKYNSNCFVKIAYLLVKLPSRLFALKKKKAFDNFRKKYLKLTKNRYYSYDALKENPPAADIYVAGSDQIWNTDSSNGKDSAFYLDFGAQSIRKISYAASFSTDKIDVSYQNFVQSHLSQFNSISVRERKGVEILSHLNCNGVHVCDPVLLLSRRAWQKLLTKSIHLKEYLLIYDFEYDSCVEKIAKKISSELNLEIIVVNTSLDYADKCYPNAGPLDFLNLIANADFVISNSFHATVFSLIFEKDFLVYPRKENINSRMIDLLNYLELDINYVDNENPQIHRINYELLNKKILDFVNSSKKYLTNNLY